MKTQETISVRLYKADQQYLMRLMKKRGYNSVATTLNKLVKKCREIGIDKELE